jgi:protein gp37
MASTTTGISWCDATWNVVVGCTKVSQGCRFCYAKTLHDLRHKAYLAGKLQNMPQYAEPFERVQLMPDRLTWPLSLRKPHRIFVNSVSDLFHEDVPDEFIDRVFAVMALAPRHTFQVLTKRPARMQAYLSDQETPGRVMKAADRMIVALAIARMGPERFAPIDGFLGYLISDRGFVYSENGSEACVRCLAPFPDDAPANKCYCSAKCRSADDYDRRMGRLPDRAPTMRRMRPDSGEDGHQRVTLYADGTPHRALVHRLVLQHFVGFGAAGDQGCHRDGDPTNNALPNLRWGDQASNWADRKRHGNGRSHSILSLRQVEEIKSFLKARATKASLAESFGVSDTLISAIEKGTVWADRVDWPLPNCWAGVSVENQAAADERIPLLLHTPAAVRWLSCEPLLGPVDLSEWFETLDRDRAGLLDDPMGASLLQSAIDEGRGEAPTLGERLNWVVVGGESGSSKQHPRPMHPDWARSLRDQCVDAGVPYHFKQWGDYLTFDAASPCLRTDGVEHFARVDGREYRGEAVRFLTPDGTYSPDAPWAVRAGTKRAGRELDGRTWDDFPAVRV